MIQFFSNQPDRITGGRAGRLPTKGISSKWQILCILNRLLDYLSEKGRRTRLIRKIWPFWLHRIMVIVSLRRKRWQKAKRWLGITGNFVSQPLIIYDMIDI